MRCAIVLLAACYGAPTPISRVEPPRAAPSPCPPAKDVWMVEYARDASDLPGHWRLPLKIGREADAPPAGYVAITAATVEKAELPDAPKQLWILDPGRPACLATAKGYYKMRLDTLGIIGVEYGVLLASTCVETKERTLRVAIAAPSGSTSSSCSLALVHDVAERSPKSWSPYEAPDDETPMPAALEAALPARACAPPCQRAWHVAEVDVAHEPIAWEFQDVLVTTDPAKDACSLERDGRGGLYLAGAHPHRFVDDDEAAAMLGSLYGALADERGARVLITQGVDDYETFDLGAKSDGHNVRWALAYPEAFGRRGNVGPYCGI